jgi:hypothetical protein
VTLTASKTSTHQQPYGYSDVESKNVLSFSGSIASKQYGCVEQFVWTYGTSFPGSIRRQQNMQSLDSATSRWVSWSIVTLLLLSPVCAGQYG